MRRIGLFLALVIGIAVALTSAVGAADRDVLVLGGTGALGSLIVQQLVAEGDRVTVFTRPGSDRERLDGLPVRYSEGDLTHAADVAAAFASQRYHAVISAVRVETDDTQFYATIMPPLVAGARQSGVEQFIHASAVGAGANAARFADRGWGRVPGLLDRLRDQGIGEDILKASGLRYTIIRNARLYPEGTAATGQASLTEDPTVLEPMTRADLAALTVGCLDNAECFDKTFHVRDSSGLAWPPPAAAE